MREILFRGKKPNGTWVEGNLFIPDKPDTPTQICIGTNIIRVTYDVIPETVGQYTGLTDKNGKKIFEGDIVCFHGNLYDGIFSIVFADGCFRLGTKNGYSYTLQNLCSALEVIGNIHDNPELLRNF